MKRTIWRMAALGLALAAAGCGDKEAQVVEPRAADQAVAIWVDQASILQSQVQKEATRLFANVPKDVPAEDVPRIQARLLAQAVDNLLVRQLVKAEMERSGVLVTAEELEQGKKDLERGLGEGRTLTMLLAAANMGMEELEGNLRLDLFKNKVLKDKLQAANEAVTEEAVKKFYEENLESFTQKAGRTVQHILIRVPRNADEAAKMDARARAEGIRAALLEGADFATLARESSQCISRGRGGMLGVVPRGREAPAFEEAVYAQEIGAIGEVVETPVGFHVIKATGEQEESIAPYEAVRRQIEAELRARGQQRVTAEYVKGLREKATIKFEGALAEIAKQGQEALEAEKAKKEAAVTAVEAEEPAAP